VISSSDEVSIVLKQETFQRSSNNGKLMTTFSGKFLIQLREI